MRQFVVFSFLCLSVFPVLRAQTSYNHFVGIHYNAMGYDPIDGTTKTPLSGVGIVLNRSLNSHFSIECAYHNAWINETNQGVNYRFTAHAVAIRAGFGATGEKWSGHVLVGPSVMHNAFGLDLGGRVSYNLNGHWRVFGAAIATGHSSGQFPEASGGVYKDPLSALVYLNAQVGLGWNFSLN